MNFIAGVDEVGRGSLVGPVYAAAVILNKSINKKLLKDSILATIKAEPTIAHSLNSPKLVSIILETKNPPKKLIKFKIISNY